MKCPHCRVLVKVPSSLAGKNVRCTKCKKVFLAQAPIAESEIFVAPHFEIVPQRRADAGLAGVPDDVLSLRSSVPMPQASARPLKLGVIGIVAIVFGVLIVVGASSVAGWWWLSNRPNEAVVAKNEHPNPDPAPKPVLEVDPPENKLGPANPEIKKDPIPPANPQNFNLAEIRKSVVFVQTLTPQLPPSVGSGFLIDKSGLIATNRHVIRAEDEEIPGTSIVVGVPSLSKAEGLDFFKAEIVFCPDAKSNLDFALLKIAAKPGYPAFPVMPLSQAKPDLGTPVAALGFPFIAEGQPVLSFNKGIISSEKVLFDGRAFYQTDAAINSGNSGGPLVNSQGEAVGIVTLRKRDANNMSYALYLKETNLPALPQPALLARARPEPGPLEEGKIPVSPVVRPKVDNWEIGRGSLHQEKGFLAVENKGGSYWITSKEPLPENFQLIMRCHVEFYKGKQVLQISQKNFLRMLCVRFGAVDHGEDILSKTGVTFQFTHTLLHLYQNQKHIDTQSVGNPNAPFLLTIVKQGDQISFAVDGRTLMKQTLREKMDSQRFSIGGFLSELLVGSISITKLDSGPEVAVRPEPKKPMDPTPTRPEPKAPLEPEPVRPPAAGEPTEVTLPFAFHDVAVGGAGRYLFFSTIDKRPVQMFDVVQGKIIAQFPVKEEAVKIAAGFDKLILSYPSLKRIERWDFHTKECEASAQVPGDRVISHMAMGSASHGPLACAVSDSVRLDGHVHFFDVMKFQWIEHPNRKKMTFSNPKEIRASAEGSVFGGWNTHVSPSGILTFVLRKADFAQHYKHESTFGVLPTADGNKVFTSKGILTNDLIPAGGHPGPCIPSQDGHFYCRLNIVRGRTDDYSASIHIMGDSRPLVLHTLPLGNAPPSYTRGVVATDKRIHFVAEANALVILPHGNSKIVTIPVALEDRLKKAGIDYLYTTSHPNPAARPGAQYRYAIAAKSNKANITYRIESGPKDMAIDDQGVLTWQVPKDTAGEVPVVVVLSAAGDLETKHSLRLQVGAVDAKPPVATIPSETRPEPKTPPEARPIPETKAPPETKAKPSEPREEEPPPPPPAGEPKEVTLPFVFNDVAAGGGGRYLFFSTTDKRPVQMFDVVQGKVIAQFPVKEEAVKIAAGFDKLILAYPSLKRIERWDFITKECEASGPIPGGRVISQIAMGSASHGLLACICDEIRGLEGQIHFFDVKKFQWQEYPTLKQNQPNSSQVRASSQGSVFGGWSKISGVRSLILREGDVSLHKRDGATFGVLPTADGSKVFTSMGILTNDLLPAGGQSGIGIPSHDGNFYSRLILSNFHKELYSFSVHIMGDSRPLIHQDIRLGEEPAHYVKDVAATDKRIHLVAEANAIVVLPFDNFRIVTYPVALDDRLKKTGIDYLYTTTHPNPVARPSAEYRYAIVARSNKGNIKYRIDSGPKGMKIDGEGLLTWQVPKDAAGEVSVAVVLSAGDLETKHSFQLHVETANAALPIAKIPENGVDLQEPPAPPPIAALVVREPTTVTLPFVYDDVAAGGGGRYLFFSTSTIGKRSVQMFDVFQGEMVGQFPVKEEALKIAAGFDKLIIAYPTLQRIERWDFHSKECEATASIFKGRMISEMAMGSASHGPLACILKKPWQEVGEIEFLDVMSFQSVALPVNSSTRRAALHIRASAEGSVFGSWCPEIRPDVTTCILREGNFGEHNRQGSISGILPTADGNKVFTSEGVFTNDLIPAGGQRGIGVPSQDSPFYSLLSPKIRTADESYISIHIMGDSRALISQILPEIVRAGPLDKRGGGPLDKRVHLVAAADALVILPIGNTKIMIYPVALENRLKKTGIDYLYTTSHPNPAARPGAEFRYAIAAKCNKGNIKYRIDSGPKNMTIDNQGVVTWPVPKDASGEVSVVVVLNAAGDLETKHSFRLRMGVVDAKSPPMPEPSPATPPEAKPAVPLETKTKTSEAKLPEGWQEHISKKDAYRIWFPKDGELIERQVSIPLKVGNRPTSVSASMTSLIRKGEVDFVVSRLILIPEIVMSTTAKSRLELFRDKFVADVRGTIVEVKAFTLGTYKGNEYLIETPKGMVRYRILGAAGTIVYRVAMFGSKDQVSSKDADIFFDSFRSR